MTQWVGGFSTWAAGIRDYVTLFWGSVIGGPVHSGRRRRREIFGDMEWIFMNFLHKIDDFETKILKKFAPAARFP